MSEEKKCMHCGSDRWPSKPPAPVKEPPMWLEMCSHRWEEWAAWLNAKDARILALLKRLAEDRCGYCCPEPHCPCCGASPMVDGLPMPCLPDCELAALIRELS